MTHRDCCLTFWLFLTLTLASACASLQVYPEPSISLRESPTYASRVVEELPQGTEVELLQKKSDWWRVRSQRTGHIGWITADQAAQVSIRSVMPAASVSPKNYLFVGASSLELHSLPLASSPLVGVLQSNDKVEKIAESGSGWFKVRHLSSGAKGWTLSRYLKEAPVLPQSPIASPPKKTKKKPLPKVPREEVPLESEPLRPEAM